MNVKSNKPKERKYERKSKVKEMLMMCLKIEEKLTTVGITVRVKVIML